MNQEIYFILRGWQEIPLLVRKNVWAWLASYKGVFRGSLFTPLGYIFLQCNKTIPFPILTLKIRIKNISLSLFVLSTVE